MDTFFTFFILWTAMTGSPILSDWWSKGNEIGLLLPS